MKLIDQSIRNYHTVTVIIVMALVVGVLCFQTLPRQLTPTVDKPQIEVRTEYPGLSPNCLLYTSPSPRDGLLSRMPSSA